MFKLLVYTGTFPEIVCAGLTFKRGEPVAVPLKLAKRLLVQPDFAEHKPAEPVKAEPAAAAEEAKASKSK